MLLVATTLPLFCAICGGGTRVAELVIEDSEVVDEEANAVDPEIWEDRELWLIVCPNPGSPVPALLVPKTGAVLVRERGACADIWVAMAPVDMGWYCRRTLPASKCRVVVSS